SITAGVINMTNAKAVGTGTVTLFAGTELRTTGTFTLTNTLEFPAGQSATLSTNGTLTTVGGIGVPAHTNVTFGSPGNAGTILPSNDMAIDTTATVTVAYGTLGNGGWLGEITGNATTTTVNAGATVDIHDQSLTIRGLLGSGAVKLGTKVSTI